jgi:hypothetical protein
MGSEKFFFLKGKRARERTLGHFFGFTKPKFRKSLHFHHFFFEYKKFFKKWLYKAKISQKLAFNYLINYLINYLPKMAL